MTDTTPTPADVARLTYTQRDVAAQIADLERELAAARHEALTARVMADYGLTSEDALLLSGEDEATLTAQARRLKERTSEGAPRASIAPDIVELDRVTYDDDAKGMWE